MSVDWPTVFAGMKTVLDPLAASSWPIAFGVGVFALRQPIARLLDRIKTVSGWGASLDIAPKQDALQHQQDGVEGTSVVPAQIDPTAMPAADPVFDSMDRGLMDTLDKVLPGNDALKLAWAVRQRSISEANRIHETHYRMIFGSQIRALITLNQAVQGEVSTFERFFNEQVLADPANAGIHQGRTFEQWGQFLVDAAYVELVEGSDPALVRITPFGRQFCAWLAFTGASQLKLG